MEQKKRVTDYLVADHERLHGLALCSELESLLASHDA